MTTTRDRDSNRAPGRNMPGQAAGEFHRLLVASVIDYAIFGLDADGYVASWNEGAQRMKGYTADEIVGLHFSTFYPEDAKASDHPAYELEVASAEGRYEEEGWRIRKDGSRFWANVVITALRNDDGELVGFAKVTRDLTERRAAEQEAIETARRLAEAEAASRAKNQFLMTLSHELRTPLNAIGGHADLLSLGVHGPVTDAQQDALQRIRSSQQHLLALITDLLNVSRIESGQVRYDLADIMLCAAVDRVSSMIEPLADARGIELEVEDAGADVRAHADRDRVEQILLNLLTNAVKYSAAGDRITVGCGSLDDGVAVEVADTGLGIPADRHEAIFEPFTQLGRSYSSPQEGVGLGLAISRDLARAMGGDLTVDSEPGRGSTFTLTLPAADSGA